MDISIIILNYKSKGLTLSCIKSIKEADFTLPQPSPSQGEGELKHEIIVVDNNSGDSIGEILNWQYPEVKFIQNKKNLGMGAGNNVGIRRAMGEYIVIVNPDILVFKDTFRKLYDFMESNKDVGVIGPLQYNPDKTIQHSCYRWHSLFTPLYRRTPLGKFKFARRDLDRFLMKDLTPPTPPLARGGIQLSSQPGSPLIRGGIQKRPQPGTTLIKEGIQKSSQSETPLVRGDRWISREQSSSQSPKTPPIPNIRGGAKEVDWLLGSFLFCRGTALKEVGMFDERFFLYFEDTDLCRRFWRKGWKVVYFPEAKVIHNHSRQSARGSWYKFLGNAATRYHIASWVKYLRKWGYSHKTVNKQQIYK
jgi:GT2 family glycosyltransferase